MANIRTPNRAFSSGELSPYIEGRVDIDKYKSGLSLCKNFIVLPQGPVINRAGFRYIYEAKFVGKKTRLMPFIFSNNQSFALEFGHQYVRFHSLGATLKDNMMTNGGFVTGYSDWAVTEVLWQSGKLTISGATKVGGLNLNPAFATNLSSWTVAVSGTGTSISRVKDGDFHGKAKITLAAGAHTARLYTSKTLTPGVQYVISATISGRACRLGIGSSSTVYGDFNQTLPKGEFEHVFTATSATTFFTFYGLASQGTGYVTDIYIREAFGSAAQAVPTTVDETYVINIDVEQAGTYQIQGTTSSSSIIGSTIISGALVAGNNQITFVATTAFSRLTIMGGGVNYRVPIQSVYMTSDSNIIPFEISTAYQESELFDIRFAQSGDIITLVHANHPPRELKRWDNSTWTLTDIVFATQTVAPASCTAVVTGSGGVTKKYKYCITSLNSLGYEESLASPESAFVNVDLTLSGNFVTITWPAVTGAVRYNVYKYASGNFGYIGQTNALTFIDDNVLADMTRTLPLFDNIFTSQGNYPGAVGYHEQRRWFAGSNNEPQNFWGTQPGTETNMNYSVPTKDSDALRLKISSTRANQIKHIVPMIDLIMMTASTEYRVVFPDTSIKPQAQNGCSNVPPLIVNNTAIHAASQGGHLREISYQWQINGYESTDLCLFANHLFDNHVIVDLAFSRAPYPVIYVVSDTGTLLGMTYLPEQKINAWHQHTTDGFFESICVVPEGNFDVLYAVIRRTINGVTKRYIEQLDTRAWTLKEDAFFVDSGLSYSGSATSTLTGLDHLEGKTVAILGDGAVMPSQVVTGGAINLPVAVTKAHVGLPIAASIKTMPNAFEDPTGGQSRIKNINKVWVNVHKSGAFNAGPDELQQTPIKFRSFEPYGTPPELKTGEFELVIKSDWNQTGQIAITQNEPLPLEIINFTMEVAVGG